MVINNSFLRMPSSAINNQKNQFMHNASDYVGASRRVYNSANQSSKPQSLSKQSRRQQNVLYTEYTDKDGRKHKTFATKSSYGSVLDQAKAYAKDLWSQTKSAKDKRLVVKKLQYDAKSISSQIIRSKTSTNARQVAGKARREVQRLKREQASGKVDKDEVSLAITHAKAMERVAKKKARHLLQEELIKVTGNGSPEEATNEEKRNLSYEDKEKLLEELKKEFDNARKQLDAENGDSVEELNESESGKAVREAFAEMIKEQRQAMLDELKENSEELSELSEEDMDKLMEEMMDELEEEMMEELEAFLEEMGLDSDGSARREMDAAEFEKKKTKHRTDEMKAITKADSEYLKGLFDHYEDIKKGETADNNIGNSNASSKLDFSIPDFNLSVGTTNYSAGVDIAGAFINIGL